MTDGRRFENTRRVRLGDVTVGGRLRLDGLARYLQDVAADDTEDAHMPDDRGWILRRSDLAIGRLPKVYEALVLRTWCTGVGSRWAERTTTISGVNGLDEARTSLVSGVLITVRAIWVNIDLTTGAPVNLPPEFFAVYGAGLRDRQVSARLGHPKPDRSAPRSPWPTRVTDFDMFGHINNAIYWTAVEELLAAEHPGRRVAEGDIEFRSGVDPGERCEMMMNVGQGESTIWFVVGDDVRASVRVRFEPESHG